MSKKYLNLDEAAQMLAMAPEELVRLRERGDVRGFADRGTWKFKSEDIESLLRKRQADSSPELPLIDPSLPLADARGSKSDMGEQPTVIRRERASDSDNLLSSENDRSMTDSDSDVRLSSGTEMDLDFDIEGDSDVKLSGIPGSSQQNNFGTDPEIVINKLGSDSDVRLVRSDSDSDVKLTADSDSDVKLTSLDVTDAEVSLRPVTEEGGTDHGMSLKKKNDQNSDSDVKLVSSDSAIVGDVSLMDDDDDAIAIDFNTDHSRNASVLDDDSVVPTGRDSSLLLGESGISLAGPSDSGINLELNDDAGLTLAIDDESGISLDAGESGISLESAESGISLESAESGISLEEDHGGTVPMIDIFADDDAGSTHFEVESMPGEDSSFDMLSGGATGEIDTLEDSASDAVFNLDDEVEEGVDEFGEDMDLEAEAMDGELDVFDADEAAFDEAGAEGFSAAPVGRMRSAEAEWGTMTFVGLSIGSVLLVLCGVVMVDLVKNTATAATPNPVSGQILELIGGLFK